jgi:RNA polymerase sigma factor (sigma-70 family)
MSGMSGTVAVYGGDDTELVTAVRRGDDRAFEVLYRRYHARIAAYVRGMVKDHARAEDVTQEVFFAALRRMRDTERPIAFKPWIYEIARNACIDAYRRTSRADELSYDAEGGLGAGDHLRLVSPDQGPDAAVESKQRLNDLCGAFGGLSEAHHQILVLRELEGLSYREIGERLGMSRPAVESTLFRARRRLTEEYDELVSGRRCERVQAIITSADEGMLGARDRRKLARHTATCQACRRHARRLGLGDVEAPATVRGKLAAFVPIPAFLRRGGDGAGVAGGHGSNLAAQVSSSLGAMADPVAMTWTKAVAAAAALAFAGAGAHVAAQNGHPLPGLGHLPLVGAKQAAEPAKSDGGDGKATSGIADPQSVLSEKAGAGDAAKGGSSGRSDGPAGPAAARDAGGHGDGSTSVTLPAASAPAAPAAPDASDPGISLPDVGSSGTPNADQSAPSDPSSGVQLNTEAVNVPQGTGTSAPTTPEPPSVPDVRTAVSSLTGAG